MERCDVVIIGSGIAGTGLSYNLEKRGFKGNVLLIDKKEIGSERNRFRNTFEEIIKDYGLPHVHLFKGLKFGANGNVIFTLNTKFFFIDYEKACKILYKKSGAEFRREKAVSLSKNVLKTDKGNYKFKYLIDCSGFHSFLRPYIGNSPPIRYWIGKTRVFKKVVALNKKYFYYFFSDENSFEDFYPLENMTIQGDWKYVKKIDFKSVKFGEKSFYKKYLENQEFSDEKSAVIPSSPVLPMVYKNMALLGDSFGNATTNSSEGIRPILRTSELLADCIIEEDIKKYENEWKRKYLGNYCKYLATRMDLNSNLKINSVIRYPPYSEFLKVLGNYKDIVLKRLRNEECSLPDEVKRKFPILSALVRQMIYRSYVKLKYVMM
jgi:flavin-dependent dehydrogenase